MPTSAALMTVEELRRLPEPANGTTYELHPGELVSSGSSFRRERSGWERKVTIPKYPHRKCSERIAAELRARLADKGSVIVEYPFRALPDHEARRADVAFVFTNKDVRAEAEQELFGEPDLAVEVLSRSHTAAEMDDKQAPCVANGCREFWLVNPVRQGGKVTRPDRVKGYRLGEEIPLDAFGSGSISMDRIFPAQRASV